MTRKPTAVDKIVLGRLGLGALLILASPILGAGAAGDVESQDRGFTWLLFGLGWTLGTLLHFWALHDEKKRLHGADLERRARSKAPAWVGTLGVLGYAAASVMRGTPWMALALGATGGFSIYIVRSALLWNRLDEPRENPEP